MITSTSLVLRDAEHALLIDTREQSLTALRRPHGIRFHLRRTFRTSSRTVKPLIPPEAPSACRSVHLCKCNDVACEIP